jgi:hypothetical protein
MRVVERRSDWILGFEDETWWSRFARPAMHSWAGAGESAHLVEQVKNKDDPDQKALACYGLLLHWMNEAQQLTEKVLLRFVDGRPVSAITIQFLEWCCQELQKMGKRGLAMIWDNASWHISQAVRDWIRAHNQEVRRSGEGVRILVCLLPVKSPWLNPIEPKWMHGKRRVFEPNGLLSARELADRVCANFGCAHDEHLSIAEKVS